MSKKIIRGKHCFRLLYEEDIQDVSQFHVKIDSLSEEDLKYICLPFLGEKYEKKRRLAASRDGTAIHELKELTHDHQFFSDVHSLYM